MKSHEKPDFWTQKAQKEGYPARSAYKLAEIDDKFGFFAAAAAACGGLRVLDLGAAPGSWSLYVIRRYGKGGRANPGGIYPLCITAADLMPLSLPVDPVQVDFFFVEGDITGAAIRETLAGRGPYSAIISDAAPSTTGSRTIDTLRSLALAEEALAYAERCLLPGGSFVVKVFQGGDSAALLGRIKEQFERVKSFKPAACRSGSFETYFVGLGRRCLAR